MQRMIAALIGVAFSSQSVIMIAQHQIDCVASESVRVWTPITPAVVQSQVEPTWPALLRNARGQGTVLLDVWIDENGRVTCVKVTRSIPILDHAVVTAVHQWRFVPAMLDEKPVAVVQQVGVRYPPKEK